MEARRVADAFAEVEVERASAQVASALQAHRQILQTLQAFLHDNHQLTTLVQDLPQKVSHSVMVPFGKAAFFPGRLVHTNEFLVLLGEGYYVECSASRTLNILDRRAKLLSSKIADVNSQIADLGVETRFFTETLDEAAGGFVEIREEYVESASSASASNLEVGPIQRPESDGVSSTERIKEGVGEVALSIEDKEHELLMARLDELEAAEAAANWDLGNPCSTGDKADLQPLEHDREQFIANDRHKVGDSGGGIQALGANEWGRQAPSTNHGQVKEFTNFRAEASKGRPILRSPGDILKFEEWKMYTSREENPNQAANVKSEAPNPPASQQSNEKSRVACASEIGTLKAFTGSVVERSAPSLLIKPSQDEAQAPKRPTSKFKMRQTKDN